MQLHTRSGGTKVGKGRRPKAAEVRSWLKLGGVQLDKRKFAEAARALKRVVDARPELGEAWLRLGLALERLDDLEEARRCFARAWRLGVVDAEPLLADLS